jgi:hypothetical protein
VKVFFLLLLEYISFFSQLKRLEDFLNFIIEELNFWTKLFEVNKTQLKWSLSSFFSLLDQSKDQIEYLMSKIEVGSYLNYNCQIENGFFVVRLKNSSFSLEKKFKNDSWKYFGFLNCSAWSFWWSLKNGEFFRCSRILLSLLLIQVMVCGFLELGSILVNSIYGFLYLSVVYNCKKILVSKLFEWLPGLSTLYETGVRNR